ncbi:Csi1p KNAG_0M02180 [Huiozyma naganishii CBS 8797]|uniref:Uncharacterized protein n=1 Tax=Huiozyma naganishii (strain ATCC MYA-139 / BCRC 22969 / CBS 8797 / KCTC 17520 / NBRC 10181 / NCYC 3082 / Yp74L-3) TaxID=1071383 RepID=J7SBI5_HUIN7|nr:hypothetical protein KNAG_0M02180 [Kazachstania naganishii CBS 8797]CCK73071.1 hypothetical protein KNAG_0M02180 [Kazachstania naganishii CBS 8797]
MKVLVDAIAVREVHMHRELDGGPDSGGVFLLMGERRDSQVIVRTSIAASEGTSPSVLENRMGLVQEVHRQWGALGWLIEEGGTDPAGLWNRLPSVAPGKEGILFTYDAQQGVLRCYRPPCGPQDRIFYEWVEEQPTVDPAIAIASATGAEHGESEDVVRELITKVQRVIQYCQQSPVGSPRETPRESHDLILRRVAMLLNRLQMGPTADVEAAVLRSETELQLLLIELEQWSLLQG